MRNRSPFLLILSMCVLAACAVPGEGVGPGPTAAPQPAASTAQPAAAADTAIGLPPTAAPQASESHPFPQHVRLAPGSILPSHRTQAQLDDDVRAFYDHWKSTYVLEAGTSADGHPLYRIAFGKDQPNKDTTVSEGQGYGMVIVPLMAGYDPEAQKIFDGLWEFTRAHPSQEDPRLMDWKVPDTASGNDSAFDGDADMAYGLLLADAQWGSQGRIDYRSDAATLISGILESTIGPDSHMPLLGDWTDPNGQDFSQYTPRSSDFMLVNFRAYGKTTGDRVWDDVVSKTQAVMAAIQKNYSPATGLIPDFILMAGDNHAPQPAPPGMLESPNDGHFYYNAGRVPWRVGTDAVLNNDATSRAIAQKLSHWAESTTGGDPHHFKAGYDLEGNPVPGSDYFSTFFVAPLGVAAMTDASQQDWLNAVYDSVYNQHQDYYEDSVTMLCLLVMSGNAWTP